MSDIDVSTPKGVLHRGWSAEVGDYAIAGGWSLAGESLIVGDTEGGVYAFDGESGAPAWAQRGVHDGGVLSVAIHPSGSVVRHGRTGRPSLNLGRRRRSGEPGYRRRKRLGGKRGVVVGRPTIGGLLLPAGSRV